MPHFFSHQRNKPLTNPKLAHLAEEWKQLTTLLPKATQTRWHSLLGVRHINNGNVCEEIKTWRRRQWQPTPVLLHGKSHGRRSMVGVAKSQTGLSDFTFTVTIKLLSLRNTVSALLCLRRLPGSNLFPLVYSALNYFESFIFYSYLQIK